MNAVLAYVGASDTRVTGHLRAWCPPRFVRVWMLAATRLADGWLWAALALALLAGGEGGRRVLAAGTLAAAVAGLLLYVLKLRVRRPRPCAAARFEQFDVAPPDRWSFPSGHATNAFAVCSLLALSFPLFSLPLLLAAASIAASRVVLGLHFVSDVLAGALLGALVGVTTYSVVLA